jgi:hypothetical protein
VIPAGARVRETSKPKEKMNSDTEDTEGALKKVPEVSWFFSASSLSKSFYGEGKVQNFNGKT